jgi:hypothetical protein
VKNSFPQKIDCCIFSSIPNINPCRNCMAAKHRQLSKWVHMVKPEGCNKNSGMYFSLGTAEEFGSKQRKNFYRFTFIVFSLRKSHRSTLTNVFSLRIQLQLAFQSYGNYLFHSPWDDRHILVGPWLSMCDKGN